VTPPKFVLRSPVSLFPFKLILGYVVAFCLVPDILYCFDSQSGQLTSALWNSELLLSLLLCVPLAVVIGVAAWLFPRMPYFCGACILASLLMITDAAGTYLTRGFDPHFEIGLGRFNWAGLCILFFILAVPFLISYFVWRARPGKRA
jgi:hypothetical protein